MTIVNRTSEIVNPQRVVIVTGPPAAGKTTLARQLATALDWPFLYKDGINEMLFDGLGFSDRAWSQKLGSVTWDVMLHFTELLIHSGGSFVVEGNFTEQHHAERFKQWREKYDCRYRQIHCDADVDVLYERYCARVESGERHPGHVDHSLSRELFVSLFGSEKFAPMNIGGDVIKLDTTDFVSLDVDALLNAIRMV
ncbi:MAG: ATP-binding protein [Caldilineaceae bacterium]|nr:ATP-binding protein [Caldilineaceae bacterium]